MDDPRPKPNPHESHPELSEQRLKGESVYQGRLLRIYKDWVRAPDGHEQLFEYTLHPGASAILALHDDGRIVLERQWRYCLNKSFLEVPAGKLNPGEDPLLAAQRELQEETGYSALRWAKLGEMHPVIGYSTEVIHLYVAKGLKAGPTAREGGECMELAEISTDEFFRLIERGEITDSKTLSCAFWLHRIQHGKIDLNWVQASY